MKDVIALNKLRKLSSSMFLLGLTSLLIISCGSESEPNVEEIISETVNIELIEGVFGDNLSLNSPFDYAFQNVPVYINDDNIRSNEIEDRVATLGRVLFYDTNLSTNNTISCSSCHKQEAAFGDFDQQSQGVNGLTGRHSMRLVNARFADEERFFWDERAASLEEQTTMPIQDHNEMGFSGEDGDPGIGDLIAKLEGVNYMPELFEYAFDDEEITEAKMQLALAQFIRSIQSFDSDYDQGRARVNNRRNDFPNFSSVENLGKALFMGRAGCDRCHQGDEFSIDENSDNNGVIGVIGDPNGVDTEVTRAPSLRDLFNSQGILNGALMHDGSFETLEDVIAHYNEIEVDPANNNLDRRLEGGPNRQGENLNLSGDDIDAIVAFVKTLSGTNVYTDEKWSNPFN